MNNFTNKYKFQLLLILIGLIWIFFLNYNLQINLQTFIFPDSISYICASENLYYFQKTDQIRPSLIAAINGFPLLFGFSKNALFAWNSFVNLIAWFSILLMIYQMVSKFRAKKTAFYISLFYLFSVGSLIIVFQILSETVFAFVLLLSLYYFQKFFENNKTKNLSIGFSLVILSVLIKPVSLGLAIILLIIFLLKLKKIIFNKWSILIYLSFLMLIFHMIEMKKNYGDFTLSYIDSFTYYNYLGTRADCLKNNTKFVQCNNERYRYFITLSLSKGKVIANEDMKNQIINNSSNFAKAYAINIFNNASKGSGYFYEFININKTKAFELTKTFFRGVSKLENIFYTLVGIAMSFYFLIRNKLNLNFFSIISIYILYILLISGISCDQGDRFHIVFYPFVLLLVAKFIKEKYFKHYVEPLQK